MMNHVLNPTFDFKSHFNRLIQESIKNPIPTISTSFMAGSLVLSNSDMQKMLTLYRKISLRKHITTHDRLDVPAQLDKLRDMQPGWLDGEGSAPSHSGLDWLSDVFSRHYPNNATLPYVYPTPEGGVDMEWSIGKLEISLGIDLANHSGEWDCYNTNTDHSDEKTLDLDDSADWKWVADQTRP